MQVSPDEFLAKWVLEVGGGIVWRPSEARSASKTLTMLRYFIPPEWITVRGHCDGNTWPDFAFRTPCTAYVHLCLHLLRVYDYKRMYVTAAPFALLLLFLAIFSSTLIDVHVNDHVCNVRE